MTIKIFRLGQFKCTEIGAEHVKTLSYTTRHSIPPLRWVSSSPPACNCTRHVHEKLASVVPRLGIIPSQQNTSLTMPLSLAARAGSSRHQESQPRRMGLISLLSNASKAPSTSPEAFFRRLHLMNTHPFAVATPWINLP